jgi:two-component system sensor histidine kinase UhpB
MSLHARLVWSMVAGLVASLALGGAIACLLAARSVETEMRSALAVARQAIEAGIARLPDSNDTRRDVESLIASFRGNRHLHIFMTGNDGAIAAPTDEAAVIGDVPGWFVRLIGVAPERDFLPVAVDDDVRTLVLQTNPRNEILEVWGQFSGSFLILALFCGQAVLLVPWLVRRALRPLDRVALAFRRVGEGDYSERIGGGLTPELAPLARSFDRMAQQLADAAAENRGLNEQLLTLQQHERGELARDLHDEVGPFLFAVKLDAARVELLARERRPEEIPERVRSILDAVEHMQRQVRAILGRLQPTGLAEFGLAAAVEALVAFWRRRHPEIAFRVRIGPEAELLDELAAATIYRVVQEGLSNAMRHGRPSAVSIRVAAAADAIEASIADDGAGISAEAQLGFGLIGMRERLRALGGALECASRPGGGVTIAARVPCAVRRRGRAAARVAAE